MALVVQGRRPRQRSASASVILAAVARTTTCRRRSCSVISSRREGSMAQFHFHPDGIVYVRAVGGVYVDTPENFLLDYGTTPPALPHGVAQALYDDSEQVLQF